MTPGIYTMPEAEYHADPCDAPSLSNSVLTTLLRHTPYHAMLEHPRLNPDRKPRGPTSSFDLGTAVHALVLEGVNRIEVVDAPDWRTKAAKEARDAARATGKLPMLTEQAAECLAMIDAGKKYTNGNAMLREVFEGGKAEQVAIWQDPSLDVWCRARIDWLWAAAHVALDYKTTATSSPQEFMKTMVPFGYHTQARFYQDGLEALSGERPRFLFLVQETAAPYLCYLVEPSETMNDLADAQIERGLVAWRHGLETGIWPGYLEQPYRAEAPTWALIEEEALIERETHHGA